MRKTLLAFLLLSAPAAAQTPVDVSGFDSIRLEGGGTVSVRHGAAQRVSFTASRPELVDIEVERGTLVIRPCRRNCTDQRLSVEVTMPEIDAAAIHGGGRLMIGGGFPARGDLALAVHGGGRLDAEAVPAHDVAVAIHGGGTVQIGAPASLAVAIHGGGRVLHCGRVEDRTVSIHGGGTIERSCGQ